MKGACVPSIVIWKIMLIHVDFHEGTCVTQLCVVESKQEKDISLSHCICVSNCKNVSTLSLPDYFSIIFILSFVLEILLQQITKLLVVTFLEIHIFALHHQLLWCFHANQPYVCSNLRIKIWHILPVIHLWVERLCHSLLSIWEQVQCYLLFMWKWVSACFGALWRASSSQHGRVYEFWTATLLLACLLSGMQNFFFPDYFHPFCYVAVLHSWMLVTSPEGGACRLVLFKAK